MRLSDLKWPLATVLVMSGIYWSVDGDRLHTAFAQEATPAAKPGKGGVAPVDSGDRNDGPARDGGLRKAKHRDFGRGSSDKGLSYPVFGIEEILDYLATRGSRLYREGKTKGDEELRKNIDRTEIALDLPEPWADSLSDRELYQRACESVFVVCSLYKDSGRDEWQTSLGTAFVVAADGILSTSCHVFDNEDTADAVIVMDVKKKVYVVTEILAANKQADTCLFRIDARNLKPLPIAEEALPGTRARVLGHPGDSFYFFSTGVVSNYERDEDNQMWMNVTADFGQGSSGGPVMDECGNVIGQVSRTFTLYAGGSEVRGRPRRVASGTKAIGLAAVEKKGDGELKKGGDRRGDQQKDNAAAGEYLDPQLVFKSCVPAVSLRALVKQKSQE